MTDEYRLEKQLHFVREIDQLKHIFRQSYLLDGSRKENDAEHSWHFAMMAILLAEHAATPGLDLLRVLKMILIHDIVEIDAGDTYCYDEEGYRDKKQRECDAAERLFGMLPDDQCEEFWALWDEFEEMQTPEAQYAAALDRLQPLMLNFYTHGKSWREHGISRRQVIARNERIREGAPELWEFALGLIDEATEQGWLKDE